MSKTIEIKRNKEDGTFLVKVDGEVVFSGLDLETAAQICDSYYYEEEGCEKDGK